MVQLRRWWEVELGSFIVHDIVRTWEAKELLGIPRIDRDLQYMLEQFQKGVALCQSLLKEDD